MKTAARAARHSMTSCETNDQEDHEADYPNDEKCHQSLPSAVMLSREPGTTGLLAHERLAAERSEEG